MNQFENKISESVAKKMVYGKRQLLPQYDFIELPQIHRLIWEILNPFENKISESVAKKKSMENDNYCPTGCQVVFISCKSMMR
jgi:hypothetical protein